jgi:hypothetical protein
MQIINDGNSERTNLLKNSKEKGLARLLNPTIPILGSMVVLTLL